MNGLLYLIRHGATDNNEANPPRLQGRRTDPGLSKTGLEQAARTARWLVEQGVDALYSSPLWRARQTAEQIAYYSSTLPLGEEQRVRAASGLTVQLVDDLIEVDVGCWEGLAWKEIEQRDPEAYRLFMTDASVHPYLDGENLSTVLSRTIPTMARLMAANLGRRVAVVAHNVVNRAYLAHLLDIPLRNYRSIPQDNCGVNIICCEHDTTRVVTINAVWHLCRS
jgi:broad specificity phosphatase PhoE